LKLVKTIIFITAVALALPDFGSAKCKCARKPKPHTAAPQPLNADLEMAKLYAKLGDWKDSESHYAAAAKDPVVQQEALTGLEQARRNADAAQTAVLTTGRLYESEDLWPRAEDLYRVASTDVSMRDEIRSQATTRLANALRKQSGERTWAEWKEWIAKVLEVAIPILLIAVATRAILKRRKAILIHPFTAPTDDLVKQLAFNLKYARARMQDPALSPAGAIPAVLVGNMLMDEEVEPIEDLEIAGTKVPLAALAKLLGKPAIQINGGFDGVAPLGYAYFVLESRSGRADGFHHDLIRVGVPNQQRQDLIDFAYDVVIKASSAYAIL
jgi:hypothetical protein